MKLNKNWYKVPAVRRLKGGLDYFLQRPCSLESHPGFNVSFNPTNSKWVAYDRKEEQRCYTFARGTKEYSAWKCLLAGFIGEYDTAEEAMDAVDSFDPQTKVWEYPE